MQNPWSLAPDTRSRCGRRTERATGIDSPADAENWSRPGRGTTGKSNMRPVFANTPSPVTLRVDENTRSGQNVGGAVEATDADRNRLTYSLEGPGADSFTIVSSSGQIRTRSALDYESRQGYSLTVKVNDGQRRDNSVAVKSVAIIVDNVDERPSAPSAPRVTGIAGSTDSVRVTWDEPANTGPPIIDYDVRCLTCPGDVFHDGADRSTIITGLTPGTRYAVEVRANNGELTGEWSRSGTGSPNPDVANQKPIFSGGARSFNIAENASSGDPIGSPVTAVDPDLDPVTHTLEGADATSFDIDPGSGQIRANAELNHEEKSRHSVTVKATDTRGGSATVRVTINVTDVAEAPDTPLAPTVTGVSSTSVQVSWDAPENTGPPITDYDYRYRDSSGAWMEVTDTTIRDTTVTIGGLAPNTFYDVEVRATNAEGTSEWSNSGNGSTNAPGANNPPVFDEGSSATRSVSASATPGTNIGEPVTAMDADSDDTVTYSLEGRDASLFDIDTANGQLRTRTGVTLLAGETYTVVVVADDGRDTSRITVSIDATAAPPNNVPVFSEGASATRSVASSAAAGTAIGRPVTATDADAGDTVTYRLEGTDPASFDINSASGQLLTRSGVTLSRTSYTVVVVADDTKDTATITVTISVIPNVAPVFSEGTSTTRAVASSEPAGTAIGQPVTATDADAGDTLTYSLEGADAASFTINSVSGQLLTRSGVTLNRSSYRFVVVASDGTASARITVTINVIDNSPPVFPGLIASRSVAEGQPAGAAVGGPVSATDLDQGDTLTYTLSGPDAASFAIGSSGQISTAVVLDYETKSFHAVVVTATDSAGDSATITVLISVTDVSPPAAPAAPTVTETAGSTTSLDVSWTAPSSEAAISDYDVQYRAGSTGGFTSWSHDGDGTSTVITGLTDGTSYEVQVRARNSEGPGDWSASGIGTTSRANQSPVFGEGTTAQRSVPEDSPVGTDVGGPVTATDADQGDTLTYRLGGADTASFSIVAASGQIRTAVVLDQETRASYTVTVTANDGTADSDPITVNITVTDITYGCASRGAVDSSNSGLVRDCEALLEARDKLQDGGARLNWWQGTPVAEWDGIRSDSLEGGRVTKLYLHGMSLSGVIAPELGDLSELKWLYLHRNELTGEIPEALNSLSKLERLYLYDNELTGISSQLGSGMSQLRRLFAQRNRISGSIPAGLGDMPRLDFLRLDRNRLTGSLPSRLGSLRTLRRLYLHEQEGWRAPRGGLTGGIPSTFGNMTRLEYLVLNRNSLNGPIPAELANLSNLKWLGLYDNSFSGQIPSELGRLSNLERMYLHGNGLGGRIPASLSSLGSLTNLWLKDNQLTGEIPSELGSLDLNRLRISGNAGLTGCVPEGLVPTRSLTDSRGRVTPPSDDIAEAGLQVCN